MGFRVAKSESLACLHCKAGRAVQIEPGLRTKSPENGNYSMNAQRLSEFSAGYLVDWELRDRLPNCKGPQLAGLCALS